MHIHHQLINARHDELLRAAAGNRLAAQARRARGPRPHHARATPARQLVGLRLHKLFS